MDPRSDAERGSRAAAPSSPHADGDGAQQRGAVRALGAETACRARLEADAAASGGLPELRRRHPLPLCAVHDSMREHRRGFGSERSCAAEEVDRTDRTKRANEVEDASSHAPRVTRASPSYRQRRKFAWRLEAQLCLDTFAKQAVGDPPASAPPPSSSCASDASPRARPRAASAAPRAAWSKRRQPQPLSSLDLSTGSRSPGHTRSPPTGWPRASTRFSEALTVLANAASTRARRAPRDALRCTSARTPLVISLHLHR